MFRKSAAAIKNHIIAGIFVIIPLAFTYVVLRGLFNIIRDFFKPIYTSVIVVKLPPLVETMISLLIALLVVYLVGLLSKIIIVARLIAFGEGILARIPVVKFIYLTTKQVLDAVALMRKKSLSKVVVVDYPRKGMKAIAFVTGELHLNGKEDRLVNIFLPSTPNPTTGFFLMLPSEEVWDVNISMEQATKMIVSGGILYPENLQLKPYTPLSQSGESISQDSRIDEAAKE